MHQILSNTNFAFLEDGSQSQTDLYDSVRNPCDKEYQQGVGTLLSNMEPSFQPLCTQSYPARNHMITWGTSNVQQLIYQE
jgi:hypothetical protein